MTYYVTWKLSVLHSVCCEIWQPWTCIEYVHSPRHSLVGARLLGKPASLQDLRISRARSIVSFLLQTNLVDLMCCSLYLAVLSVPFIVFGEDESTLEHLAKCDTLTTGTYLR